MTPEKLISDEEIEKENAVTMGVIQSVTFWQVIDRLKSAEDALKSLASIKADDGDDFMKWDDHVVIRCELSVREIKAAKAHFAKLGEKGEG